jgi:hypothetical protein
MRFFLMGNMLNNMFLKFLDGLFVHFFCSKFNRQKKTKSQYPMEKLIIASILTANDATFLATQLLIETQPLTVNDDKLKFLHDRLAGVNDRLVSNLKPSQKSLFTDKKSNLDKRRDKGFICVRDQIHGLSVSLNEKRAAMASELYAVLDRIGTNIYALGYKAESSLLQSLFKEFDKQEMLERINSLGLSADYAALKMAEANFGAISMERVDEQTERKDNEAATKLLDETVPALTKLVGYMQLNSEIDPDIYGETFNKMVTIITNVNTTARARNTRKEEKEEPEEQENSGS